VRQVPAGLLTLAHEGKKAYSAAFDLVHRREAERPNAIWQADHTLLDILVQRESENPAQPWLTVILDDYSRAVAGYFLFFEAPSAAQTALALRQAIWRKDDPRWHVCGVPDVLYTDNGTDFTSQHLEQVAADLKIRLVFSTPGIPQDEFVSRVSVFDTQCAAVYLTEKTDVAFRPFGLDLFDKLVKACKTVRAKLESEQRALGTNALTVVQATIPEGTAVAKFLANVSSLTKQEAVEALARLSPEEEARLALLEKSLLDLQANEPEKLIRQLAVRAGRVQALVRHLKEVEAALADNTLKAVFDARTEGRRKSEEAKRLREATFPQGLLQGTGTDVWTALWESARRFSQAQAYPDRPFPVVGDGTQCVLCQQDLDHEAAHRLKQFEDFVASTVERELRQIRDTFTRQRKAFSDLKTTTEAIDETLKEIRIEHEAVADSISLALASNEKRRVAVLSALAHDKDLAADCAALVSASALAEGLSAQIDERIKTLSTSANDQTRKSMTAEAQELRARKLMATHLKTVLDDIERRKKYAAYGLCIDDTKTQAITAKSTAVTKTVVSQKLKKSFQDELVSLSFRHVEVELKELGARMASSITSSFSRARPASSYRRSCVRMSSGAFPSQRFSPNSARPTIPPASCSTILCPLWIFSGSTAWRGDWYRSQRRGRS
jgi:transposase InsO family protein